MRTIHAIGTTKTGSLSETLFKFMEVQEPYIVISRFQYSILMIKNYIKILFRDKIFKFMDMKKPCILISNYFI